MDGRGRPLIDATFARTRLCIRDEKEAFSVKPRFPAEFAYLVLDVQDTEEQNLIRMFPRCVLTYHFGLGCH